MQYARLRTRGRPVRGFTACGRCITADLYELGALPKKPVYPGYAVRQDIRKLDQYVEQMRFLSRHGIDSREQLAEYRKPMLDEIAALTKERHGLYRSVPRFAAYRTDHGPAESAAWRKSGCAAGSKSILWRSGSGWRRRVRNRKNMWKRKNRKVLIRLRKDGTPCREIVDFIKKTVSGRMPHRTAQDGRPLVSVPAGTKGTVICVDDAGQLHMQWDNGRTLALVPVDTFSRIDAPAKKRERAGDAR